MSPNRTDEFVQLVSRHQSQLYGHVYALVQNADDANDLVQKTVLTLWRRFDSFEPGSDFAAWAWQTARYEVLNFLKVRSRSKVVFSDSLVESLADRVVTVEDEYSPDERHDALVACIAEQSAEDQRLLRERYEDDLKVKDLAERYGRAPNSISNSLRRIRMAVFRCIQQRLGWEGCA